MKGMNEAGIKLQDRISESSVYYCPMECEGEKVYFQQGKRCPVCNMFLVPIEEKLQKDMNFKPAFSKTQLPEIFKEKVGEYFCPMFCESDRTYSANIGCPICQMHLEQISEELLRNCTHFISSQKSSVSPAQITEAAAGKYYCPMFCEGEKTYDKNVGCPVCGMDLVRYPNAKNNEFDDDLALLKKKFFTALLFTIPVFVLSMGSMFFTFPFSHKTQGFAEFLLSLPVIFYSGWFLLKRGFISFKTYRLNMFSLIALGVTAAFVFSVFSLFFPTFLPEAFRKNSHHIPLYFEAVCVIITLVILGQLLEALAHQKTGNAIKELMNLSPAEAHLLIGNDEKKIPLSDVKVGDLLKVKPGEKIPVDGVIIEGNASIDESMITGEPVAVEKSAMQKVSSGTLNGNTVFTMRAEKVGADTLLSKIISMVNEASRSRAPIQKMTDKVAEIFVPAVIITAVFTFIIWQIFGPQEQKSWFALVNAVAVLIVACPCALGLATPMSMMVGIGKGARNGILIKNAEALEQLNNMDVLIIDKTGTLTEGKPVVRDIFAFNDSGKKDILALAYSLNKESEHPLSKAILSEAQKEQILTKKVSDFKNHPGKGISGKIDDHIVLFGNEKLLQLHQINIPEAFRLQEHTAGTLSYLAQNSRILGVIFFEDPVKINAKKAVQKISEQNIEIIMMTGDNEKAAKKVAEELGIKNYVANCLPEDKLAEVQRQQEKGKMVGMTGDGINDAPALAMANIGIAMGTGTDVAMETAEITLLKGDIFGVVRARILSKKLVQNIKQNLFFAFFYNVLGIPIAAGLLYPFFGILLSPMIAAAAMSFSSVSVIFNSLRLQSVNLNSEKI